MKSEEMKQVWKDGEESPKTKWVNGLAEALQKATREKFNFIVEERERVLKERKDNPQQIIFSEPKKFKTENDQHKYSYSHGNWYEILSSTDEGKKY